MILVCYDGSLDARAAIDRAAELMRGSEATVLTIWETLSNTLTRPGAIGAGQGYSPYLNSGRVNAARKQAALARATEGAELAIAAGLRAEPRIASRPGYVGSALLAVADHMDAEMIVLGTRGLGSVESLRLGSVSRTVLRYADRAVLIIPSSYLAAQRRASALQAGAPVGVA